MNQETMRRWAKAALQRVREWDTSDERDINRYIDALEIEYDEARGQLDAAKAELIAKDAERERLQDGIHKLQVMWGNSASYQPNSAAKVAIRHMLKDLQAAIEAAKERE